MSAVTPNRCCGLGPGINVTHITDVTETTTSPIVFTSNEGGPLRLTNLPRRQWRQAVEGSRGRRTDAYPRPEAHLSGTGNCSGCAPEGAVVGRLGHRDIQTTFNVYGGLFHEFDEDIADALDDAFTASL